MRKKYAELKKLWRQMTWFWLYGDWKIRRWRREREKEEEEEKEEESLLL
jgi:hypothetical protein